MALSASPIAQTFAMHCPNLTRSHPSVSTAPRTILNPAHYKTKQTKNKMEKRTWQCQTALESGVSGWKWAFPDLHVSRSCPIELASLLCFQVQEDSRYLTSGKEFWHLRERERERESSAYLKVNLQIRNAKSDSKRTGSYSSATQFQKPVKISLAVEKVVPRPRSTSNCWSWGIYREKASLPEAKQAVWCELTVLLSGWTRYHSGVQIKTDEAKESTNRKCKKARTKMEQEWRIMRKSRQDPDIQLHPKGLWSNSQLLKKFSYIPGWWVQT